MTRADPGPGVLVVGRGRAGGSFASALEHAGWDVESCAHGEVQARLEDPDAAGPFDLVLLCVPDAAVGTVASMVPPTTGAVVAHCAGSLGLDVLGGHPRTASVHPLVSLPDAELGAGRLGGAWFAVAGDPLARRVVQDLGGRAVEVGDDDRVAYHAAAAIASNHLVALLAQVQRVASGAGVPLEAYLDLARGSVDAVAALGPAAALTGPVARGDWATVEAHLGALDESERSGYLAGVRLAVRLVGRELPPSLGTVAP